MFGIARGGVPGRRRGSRGWESGEKDRTVVQGEGEAGGRGAEFVDEAHEGWAWSSTQAFRDGESGFMRQP
jgi:hypothetical protein